MNLKELFELSEKHPYYCSTSNYFDNDCSAEFSTWPDFVAEWGRPDNEKHGYDMDYNFMIRWDLKQHEDDELKPNSVKPTYYLELFYVGQRKGLFQSVTINRVFEDDVDDIIENVLKPHKDYILSLWNI